MTDNRYPNAYARLRLSQSAPAVEARDNEVDIWLLGLKFRVRDESGRTLSDLLGEATAPRGLGVPARTMEYIMDRYSASRRKRGEPTELFGDLDTDRAVVLRSNSKRTETSAEAIAPVAEQILSLGREAELSRKQTTKRLGREAFEYQGVAVGEEDGYPWHNDIVRVVAPPFLLFESVCNSESADHYYVREILVLEEGTVTNADVTPPGG